MAYLIYGKRAEDKKFVALDAKGHRVTKLNNAMAYATKEDAQAIVDKFGRENCKFDIRKAK